MSASRAATLGSPSTARDQRDAVACGRSRSARSPACCVCPVLTPLTCGSRTSPLRFSSVRARVARVQRDLLARDRAAEEVERPQPQRQPHEVARGRVVAPGRRARSGSRSACRAGRACCARSFIARTNAASEPPMRVGERGRRVVGRLDQQPAQQVGDRHRLARAGGRSSTRRGARGSGRRGRRSRAGCARASAARSSASSSRRSRAGGRAAWRRRRRRSRPRRRSRSAPRRSAGASAARRARRERRASARRRAAPPGRDGRSRAQLDLLPDGQRLVVELGVELLDL